MTDEPTLPDTSTPDPVEPDPTPPVIPDPPPPNDDMPDWGKDLVAQVDKLAEQVTAMTPVPPPIEMVVENDDAPVPVPWTHKPLFGNNHHGHGDD